MVRKYTFQPLPDDGELPANEPAMAMLIGPGSFVRAFLGDGLKDLLLDGVNKAAVVGADKIDGDDCWHAQFEEDGIDWELWTTQSEPTLLRRVAFAPNMDSASKAGDAASGMSMEVQVDFKDWNLKPDFSDDDFAFTPPKDAEQTETLFAGLGGTDEGPHPLLGEPAPEFEVDRLDGDAFKLADVLEKKVIMLDFWATWCGPCVEALPQVTAAAKELGEDVAFFAVNIGEEADDVRKFLDANDLEPPVLLDADGAVAKKYGANAIPQTVLIGMDGRVQVVHIGGSSDMKRMLLRDLRKLVKGEDLAAETLRKHKAIAEEADASADAEASADEEVSVEGEAR
jgi:thiol-disulfide isomerase/thioredoxin